MGRDAPTVGGMTFLAARTTVPAPSPTAPAHPAGTGQPTPRNPRRWSPGAATSTDSWAAGGAGAPGAPGVRVQVRGATATRKGRVVGLGQMLVSTVSGQSGAALGASAFPLIGPVGVVALRQLVTATVLVPAVRPRLHGRSRAQWLLALGLVVVFSVMNLSLYLAVERLGLGLAVTIEFLGPLAVAILGSRRRVDLACALLAGVGVVVLTNPGPTTDVAGILLALAAAAAWAGYILLNRAVGQQFSGLDGPALASGLTALAWLPVAAWWFSQHPLTWHALALAAGCALLASVVPYAFDVLALRRVPAPVFGTFASVNPVIAALMGWLVLHQSLDAHEWAGIALIVASNALVSARGLRHPH